jgi:hypothetical protein
LGQQQRYRLSLVPWEDFPAQFRDPGAFRADIGLGQRLRMMFAGRFWRDALEPGQPRDLILRGRFAKATRQLVEEDELWRDVKNRRAAEGDNLGPLVAAWAQRAVTVYAQQVRAGNDPGARAAAQRQIDLLWKEARPVEFLILIAMSGARGADVTYELGLCKHEYAQRLQALGDRRAAANWEDALDRWQEYARHYPKGAAAAAVRRLRGRAQAMLGQKEAAIASWRDPSGLTELEKLANLYQARQLEKKGNHE